jgi:ABC-type dipeptide/oligopeptide/nickel transport system ATPase subunit
LYRFKINVEKSPFAVASDIQKAIGKKNAIADVFKECYDNPYKFIKRELEQEIPENLLYKTLVKIDMNIKNDNNEEISGGERAEFILLKELEEAHNYDILLIDEPEPSFDNVFLRENVIDKLREISNKTTTFITTHNNSLGITIRPDKIIYTRKNEEGHDVFTTTLTSNLTSKSGEKLAKKSTILDVMEAGSQTYDERSKIYEGFED